MEATVPSVLTQSSFVAQNSLMIRGGCDDWTSTPSCAVTLSMGIHVHVTGEGVDWPAWVQAVGSVLAILIAAGLVKLERLHQDVASMDAFEGVGFAVKQIIDEVVTAAETHCLNGTELHQFPTRALEEMPEWLGLT